MNIASVGAGALNAQRAAAAATPSGSRPISLCPLRSGFPQVRHAAIYCEFAQGIRNVSHEEC
jgi:hypothetical protein